MWQRIDTAVRLRATYLDGIATEAYRSSGFLGAHQEPSSHLSEDNFYEKIKNKLRWHRSYPGVEYQFNDTSASGT